MSVDDAKKRRFLWGAVLAWAPWVPALIGLAGIFRGISNTKATGLTALAAGLAETFALFGLAATLVCEVGAIILLFGTFSRGHGFRGVLSVLSMGASLLMFLLFALSLWLFWFLAHHAP
jgi:hypothetical protein